MPIDMAKPDRPLLWPLLVAIGVPLVAGIPLAFEPMVTPLALAFVVWAACALAALLLTVLSLAQKRWRRADSAAILPLFIAASIVAWPSILGRLFHVGEYIRFLTVRHAYEAQVAALPSEGQPRFVRFKGRGFMLNPIEDVYDESDEVALPKGQQSEAWWTRAGHSSEYGACTFGASQLQGHFYVVHFGC
jgi:hypothetical protein